MSWRMSRRSARIDFCPYCMGRYDAIAGNGKLLKCPHCATVAVISVYEDPKTKRIAVQHTRAEQSPLIRIGR